MSDDPHYQREKEKYENPVASREFLMSLLKEEDKPLSFLEICTAVNAEEEDARIGIQRRLRAMEREGQVQFTRQKKYILQDQDELFRGKVIGHRDGFGFLRPEDKSGDLFISAGQMKLFLHDDIVEARVSGTDRRGRKEAFITQVVEPRSEPIVGRYFVEQGFGMVVPDDSRLQYEIVIPPEHVHGARMGQIVVVELTQRPRRKMSPVGKIVEVLGEHMAPGMEIEMALRTFDIPHQWPKGVTKQVKSLTEQVPDEAKEGRIDLRQLPLVTIDGEDARDFDDAVYCEPLDDGGWQLWVAIADVSYYVRNGTALDDEAQQRGNSVYFPEQVIPMLPEVLSNGLCSLNPEVDRLCMVCEMTITAQGKLETYQFYEAVMNSHARLTYTKVWQILQGDKDLHQRYEAQVPHLRHLHDLYRSLKKARQHRGAIEFETQESKFVFNAQRKIENIVPLIRNDAHKLIEECMILANVSAALTLSENEAPTLYRVHDKPDADRLTAFTSYLAEIGVPHKITDEALPADFTDVVLKTRGRPDEELIQTMLLRSMKQAIYDGDNLGHFGLALEAYAHFTSPIRRYPDLVVHRALKGIIAKQKGKNTVSGAKNYTVEEIEQLGEQCSMTERRADDATRDVADWLKCEFMLDHVGDTFEGVVSSVTNFGLFVRLTEYHIDGLVHITSLDDDFYHYDQVKQILAGESGHRQFRLGDTVEVKVAAVNLDERKIDLLLDKSMLRGPGGKKVKVASAKKPPRNAKRGPKKAAPKGKGAPSRSKKGGKR
ncbi:MULTISPECIES: ribonuclease R [Alteromonas]|jgi:ribonuclease R|uniref:Ribonuclease R n=1 Tax=Alteromonas stellipolaris TaxID=233316 RepID=A0ABM5YNA1_9ALTE|nr:MULTISPECIES: ribonuclease R [Alteromonas]AMJ92091.1 exoribonuclease R [Alteromonas sp. Mac2]ALM93003.1 3'-to-5' exoribonuclease RNase R [Alteromonas stellipolaris LMG 21856]AMJ75808.1 exoribonuclease R [Alteromonas stellipolaris]AMJ88234.1 exoribonuclease R [Alteromonas sp. Mac1]AMJ95922.1 exoribonuclease R [Alteromonas stellipolaris]